MSSSLIHDTAVPVAIITEAPAPPDSGSAADHMKQKKKKMKKTKDELESCTSASGSCNDSDAVVVVVLRAMTAADVESCDRPAEMKLQIIQSGDDESERGCRICHLSRDASDHDSDDGLIELGCSCKDDLAAAHRHCAETWFKIKGDKMCEICGSIACNLSENLLMEAVGGSGISTTTNNNSTGGAEPPTEAAAQNCWQGQRLLNFVLACVIFFFLISWLFHFNVPA